MNYGIFLRTNWGNEMFFVKCFIFFVLFFSLGGSVFAFPKFDFSQSSYPLGDVEPEFTASRGLSVDLYVNDDIVGSVDTGAEVIEINLSSSMSDIIVPVYSKVRFINRDELNVFVLNISGIMYRKLEVGESSSPVLFDRIGTYDLRDENSMTSKVLIVEDSTADFKFPVLNQNRLLDGENKFKFKISSPYNDFDSYEEEFTIRFQKFTNTIEILEVENITKNTYVNVSGKVSESGDDLYYVVNSFGTIANSGFFINNKVELNNGEFSVVVSGLREGENSIRFISTKPGELETFTGDKSVSVYLDTEKPVINIVNVFFRSNVDDGNKVFVDGNNVDTNYGSVVLNISAEGKYLNYSFNGQNNSVSFNNGTFELELSSLKSGKNDLDLVVADEAGNIAHKAMQINYVDTKPDLITESLKPESIFKQKSAHFFLSEIEGKTNVPNLDMVIFTIPEGSKDYEGKNINCEDYKNVFLRDQGNDGDAVDPEFQHNDYQLSLLSLLNFKQEISSDGDGEFETLITLQEKDFDVSKDTKKVQPVKTRNKICFILKDKFGVENIKSFDVEFDAGNTMWQELEVTPSPGTFYEFELRHGETAERSGDGNIEIGIMAKFQYVGGSKVESIKGVDIRMDSKLYPDTQHFRIITERMHYEFSVEEDLMVVYFPVAVTKYESEEEADLFDSLELGFAMSLTYDLIDSEVPIDTTNPVYFQTKVAVENNLDWLSVEQIEKFQEFLGKTINITEKAVEYLKWGTIGGVGYCVFSKVKYAWKLNSLNAEKSGGMDEAEFEKKAAELERDLYMACDRIASQPSPYECDTTRTSNFMKKDVYTLGIDYQRKGKKVGQMKPNVGGTCNVEKQKSASGNDADGRWVSGTGVRYKDTEGDGYSHTVAEKVIFDKQCLPYDVDKGVDFKNFKGTVCYSPGVPRFDDTKCNFFGKDTGAGKSPDWEGSGVPGKDPGTSLLSSLRCAAITDTYSHTKNLLKIQKSIYDCLEQAKYGSVKGSYCQRLLGQAVCDLATNVVLPELMQSYNPNTGVQAKDRSGPLGFFAQMKENEEKFSDRYSGTIMSQSGLQTDQIINKACLGAITGDWSVLSENILSSIDSNQVEPTFGPPMAESKLQGADYVTGELSIRYLYTYAVLSGGQTISTKVELICDRNQKGGEYCPEDGIIVSSAGDYGAFKTKTLSVRKGGSVQQSQIITEAPARFWYNLLRMTHTYELKGKSITKTELYPIYHKSEVLPLDCGFTAGLIGAGAGFGCKKFFGDSSESNVLSLNPDKTFLLPTKRNSDEARPFYEGNDVLARVSFSSVAGFKSSEGINLFYYGVCNEGSDSELFLKNLNGKEIGESYLRNMSGVDSYEVVPLFSDLPKVGDFKDQVGKLSLTSYEDKLSYYLRVRSKDSSIPPSLNLVEIKQGDKDSKVGFENKRIISGSGYKYLVFKVGLEDMGDLKFYVEGEVDENMIVDFVASSKKIDEIYDEPGSSVLFRKSSSNPGECNVYMRVGPVSDSGSVTRDNFKSYNSVGDTDTEGKVISNVKADNLFIKKSFVLNEKPSENQYFFNLISPFDEQTVSVGEPEPIIKIPMYYFLDDAINDPKKTFAINYKFVSSRYVFDSKNEPILLEFGLNGKILQGSSFNLKLPSDLRKELESNSGGNFVSNSIAGANGMFDLTLHYDFYEAEKDDQEDIKLKDKIYSDSVRFYLS